MCSNLLKEKIERVFFKMGKTNKNLIVQEP